MRPAKSLPLWLAVLVLAVRPAAADDPARRKLTDPFPAEAPAQANPALPDRTPAVPTDDTEKYLPLGGSRGRLTPSPSLLPEEIPMPKGRSGTARPPAGGKPAPTLKPQDPADSLDMRIRYRKARNIAETNDAVRSAWEDTRYRKNDDQKRRALKRYYDVLFAKMLSVDRGIAPLVEKRRKIEFAMLTQTLVAPTVPNE